MIGFQENRANELKVLDGKLTGEVTEPILGRATKLATLIELTESFDLDEIDTLVTGDGANDLGMIEAAGLRRRVSRQAGGGRGRRGADRPWRSHGVAVCAGVSTG